MRKLGNQTGRKKHAFSISRWPTVLVSESNRAKAMRGRQRIDLNRRRQMPIGRTRRICRCIQKHCPLDGWWHVESGTPGYACLLGHPLKSQRPARGRNGTNTRISRVSSSLSSLLEQDTNNDQIHDRSRLKSKRSSKFLSQNSATRQ